MQSYRDEKLLETNHGAIEELAKKAAALTQAIEATHHVIGKVPQAGEEVVINGLKWIVTRHNDQIGTLRLRLKKP